MQGRGLLVGLTFAAVLASAAGASAAPARASGIVLEGRAQPLPHGAAPPLDVRIEHCGDVLRSFWRNPDGVLLAADELELGAGDSFTRYRYWLPNVAETVRVERRGRRANIELVRDGRIRTSEIAVPEDVQVGPMLVLRARELSLGAGAPSGPVAYLVPDRFAVIAFDLAGAAGRPARPVRLTPTSVLVRQVLDPVEMRFDAGGRLVHLRGRALPAAGTPGRKRPLVVDLEITAHGEAACSNAPLARLPD